MVPPVTATSTRCSIARSLEVLGEKWTLLVVREAFWGATKFSDFTAVLSVSTDILSARLATLVDAGVFERRSYRENGSRERSSYHLTESGQELRVLLAAFTEWGDKYRPNELGPATIYRERDGQESVHLAFVTASGEVLDETEVETVRGPGSERPRGAVQIGAVERNAVPGAATRAVTPRLEP